MKDASGHPVPAAGTDVGERVVSARPLGLVSATALVVANMIGTGVFTTSGYLLADLKSPWRVLTAWVVGGVLAALGALCYGGLARRIPESGGEYVFLSRTLHPCAGYLAGWVSLLVGFSAPLAAAALAFGEYGRPWLPGVPPALSGSVLLLLFSVLHAADVRRGAWAQNGTVAVKVALIAFFVVLAGARLNPPSEAVHTPMPWAAFAVSLVWISFSYSGWNAAVYLGGEIAVPERNIPRAMVLGTGLVTGLYLALNAVFVFAAPPDQLAGRADVGRVAAEALGGPGWARAVTALVAIVLVSSVSSLVMAGPRVYAKMAADGYLPRALAATAGPPRAAIGLQCALALVLVWSATLRGLLTCIGFTLGLSTAATVLGLMRLRHREGAVVRVPGWPVTPVVFLIAVAGITLFTIAREPRPSLIGLGAIAAGAVAWRVVERKKARN